MLPYQHSFPFFSWPAKKKNQQFWDSVKQIHKHKFLIYQNLTGMAKQYLIDNNIYLNLC